MKGIPDYNNNKSSLKPLRVFLVGGGSGGHVSPLQALAKTLSEKVDSNALSITFVCEKGSSFDELMDLPYVKKIKKISAGKFRRYHGDSFISHLLDVRTIARNMRDFFKFLMGCAQSVGLIITHRPDVIFLKGGFVCVPVGWAARAFRVPYVTHDSDAVPGLANRLTAHGAIKNLVAIDGKYPYPEDKKIVTGVPINPDFFDNSQEAKQKAREKLAIPVDAVVVLVTGGGLGALMMNELVIKALNKIASAKDTPTNMHPMYVTHITGKSLYEKALDSYENTQLDPDKVKVIDFTTDMVSYVHASDLVVSRAGATAIAELAAAQKACILVPGAHLTGGQQIHNAKLLEEKHAAVVILDQDEEGLTTSLVELANSEEKRTLLGTALHEFATPQSADKIVGILMDIAGYSELASEEKTNSINGDSENETS